MRRNSNFFPITIIYLNNFAGYQWLNRNSPFYLNIKYFVVLDFTISDWEVQTETGFLMLISDCEVRTETKKKIIIFWLLKIWRLTLYSQCLKDCGFDFHLKKFNILYFYCLRSGNAPTLDVEFLKEFGRRWVENCLKRKWSVLKLDWFPMTALLWDTVSS